MESELILESVVRGYHVFQHIWNAVITEELPCRVETGNPSDRFAVAVLKQDTAVGHVPRLFSAACALFKKKTGNDDVPCRWYKSVYIDIFTRYNVIM